MSQDIFESVKTALGSKLGEVAETLLPGSRIIGREYVCASLEGGQGKSCRINLENGVGSDFATGETCSDIIDLAAKVWNVRPYEATTELARQYGIEHTRPFSSNQKRQRSNLQFLPIMPVPASAPEPLRRHLQYGDCSHLWRYLGQSGELLFCTARFEHTDGKVVLPQCFGKIYGQNQWIWKALPDKRPLYGLQKLQTMSDEPILLVEGEKTADAAQSIFPDFASITWSGGCKVIRKSDFLPLVGRNIIICPDNDKPGIAAAVELTEMLRKLAANVKIVLPDNSLPEAWDLADEQLGGMDLQKCLQNALAPEIFMAKICGNVEIATPQAAETEEVDIKAWPKFSFDACPGLLGDFVSLATRESEADPAAVCITALVRFCAEVYGFAPQKGPHILVGETMHPPRLFAVICGNSSKARKGTSRHPVTKLFSRSGSNADEIRNWQLPIQARESGGHYPQGRGLPSMCATSPMPRLSDYKNKIWGKQFRQKATNG